MPRPTYETCVDRLSEGRCVRMLTGLGFSVFQFPKYSIADMIAVSERGTYLIEFKSRSHSFGTYPTVIIPEQKLAPCLKIADYLSVRFAYVVEFEDGMYWSEPYNYSVAIGGRIDRGDPKDIEPLAHIPLDQFRKVEHDERRN